METKSAQALRERLAALQRHRAADPDNLTLACDVVDLCLQLGDTAEAGRVLDAECAKRPQEAALLYRRSSLALAIRDYPEAERILAELMAGGQDSLPVRYNRAQALLWLRRPDELIALLKPYAERTEEYPPLLLLLAKGHQQRDELPLAIGLTQAYLGLRPNEAEAYGLLALLFLDSSQDAEAFACAERALQLEPEQLEALLTRARLALNKLDTGQALESMQQAVGRYPTSGAAWSALAQAELLRTNLPGAEAAIGEALRHMPEHVGTWHLKAWCQILRNDVEGAKQSFATAYELDCNFGETHGGLAVVAAMQGDEQEARAAMKRALRLNPQGLTARYAESLLLERAGRKDEAQSVVEEVLKRPSPATGMSYQQLAAAHRARLGQG